MFDPHPANLRWQSTSAPVGVDCPDRPAVLIATSAAPAGAWSRPAHAHRDKGVVYTNWHITGRCSPTRAIKQVTFDLSADALDDADKLMRSEATTRHDLSKR